MSFKFAVGQAVEYKPVGASVGLFKVTRQMPEEFQAIDRRYRIKSDHGFEQDIGRCIQNRAYAKIHEPVAQLLQTLLTRDVVQCK